MKQIKIFPFLLLLLIILNACTQSKRKPNVVYILTDQWRASALAYSGDPNVKTPHLDAFSKEAVNFTNAVSVTPVCTPHRAALLTGRYPTSTGMFLNDLYLPDEELCMAEIFKAEGYSTAYWGKWHLDGHGRENNVAPERRQGFDYWKALECSHDYNNMSYYENDDSVKKKWPTYSPFAITEDANKYLSEHANDKEPFLMFISIATPHFPHSSAPQEYADMYPKDSIQLSPNVPKEFEERAQEELQGYYGHATATDEAIGRVLKKIKELGLDENTIIVFTADHGEMMGSHGIRPFTKQLSWDESIKIPFLIKYPSIGENGGQVINAPINTPDILPSILGLAELSIPKSIEGENLAALIQSPDENADRVALVMNIHPFTREYKYPEYRAVRTKQYTYTATLDGPSMLFDNTKDPYQMNNLIGQASFAQLQSEMDIKLKTALKNIGDEFHPRDYYMKRWNLKVDEKKKAIDYWSFDKGEGVTQSPVLK
ncbi:Arylsulfatase A [Spirosomataceae bacterium TFI 002]|nr:Arylsulfatase A [Spirosomataceae bacterium TFI 002]